MTTTEKSLLLLNTTHYKGNGVYEYTFNPTDFSDSTISIHKLAMYNSIFNVKPKYDNNSFIITWIDNTVYHFTIPDGYYEFDDINTFIEQQCLLNNLYLTKDNGTKNIFFFNLSTNPTQYKTQIDIFAVPTSTEANDLGYTKPTNNWSYPATPKTPIITFSAGLLKTLGMSQTPSSMLDDDYTQLSDKNPRLLPAFSILITCNFCDSKLNLNPKLLDQIPIDTKFSSLISYTPSVLAQLPIRQGHYDRVRIELLDQFYQPLEMNDDDFSLTLLIEKTIKK